jgi:hypothetical protein
MATQIELVSDVEGRDLVPCRSSVWSTLKELVRSFRRAGYSVSGGVEFLDRRFVGEYFAESSTERVTFHVVNV